MDPLFNKTDLKGLIDLSKVQIPPANFEIPDPIGLDTDEDYPTVTDDPRIVLGPLAGTRNYLNEAAKRASNVSAIFSNSGGGRTFFDRNLSKAETSKKGATAIKTISSRCSSAISITSDKTTTIPADSVSRLSLNSTKTPLEEPMAREITGDLLQAVASRFLCIINRESKRTFSMDVSDLGIRLIDSRYPDDQSEVVVSEEELVELMNPGIKDLSKYKVLPQKDNRYSESSSVSQSTSSTIVNVEQEPAVQKCGSYVSMTSHDKRRVRVFIPDLEVEKLDVSNFGIDLMKYLKRKRMLTRFQTKYDVLSAQMILE